MNLKIGHNFSDCEYKNQSIRFAYRLTCFCKTLFEETWLLVKYYKPRDLC